MSNDSKITHAAGRAIVVRGNDIDTDRIIPARYLKEPTFARMGDYPFFDERFDAGGKTKPHPFNDPKFKGASILFVNKNFGCGSSREHAPQALYRYGIHAVVGESFAAIFAGNCVMIGMPTVTVGEGEIEELMRLAESRPETSFALDIVGKKLTFGEKAIAVEIPETYRKALVDGSWDSTGMLRANLDKVRATATKLPYMSGFKA
jgi:3-isopropylmalate/(R)-2-methylmalate dehydratase small subunit